jgi:hypothetical protein
MLEESVQRAGGTSNAALLRRGSGAENSQQVRHPMQGRALCFRSVDDCIVRATSTTQLGRPVPEAVLANVVGCSTVTQRAHHAFVVSILPLILMPQS